MFFSFKKNFIVQKKKPMADCYKDLVAELSFLFFQFSQSETKPWSILQLLFPQGLRVMGIVGKHTLLLDLRGEPISVNSNFKLLPAYLNKASP